MFVLIKNVSFSEMINGYYRCLREDCRGLDAIDQTQPKGLRVLLLSILQRFSSRRCVDAASRQAIDGSVNQGRRTLRFFTTANLNLCPDKFSVPTDT